MILDQCIKKDINTMKKQGHQWECINIMLTLNYICNRGVRGRVVTVVTVILWIPPGTWILSCEKAIQLA